MIIPNVSLGTNPLPPKGETKFYIYTPYIVTGTTVNMRARKVSASSARQIEYLVINLGGVFEKVGGNDEAIGGDVTKMGQ